MAFLVAIACYAVIADESKRKSEEPLVVKIPKPNYSVRISVDSKNKKLESKLSYLLEKELKTIKDASVVDITKKPDFTIKMDALDFNEEYNIDIGYACSITFVRNYYYSEELNKTIEYFNNKEYGYTKELRRVVGIDGFNRTMHLDRLLTNAKSRNTNYSELYDTYLEIGNFNIIEKQCSSIISNFDKTVLKQMRNKHKRKKEWFEDKGYKIVEE